MEGTENKPVDNTTDVNQSQEVNMSEIDRILAGYANGPMEVSAPGSVPVATNTLNGGAPSQSAPFISHDPSLAPKQEYYQRGAKKGQPKPPKKGQAPPLNPAGQMAVPVTQVISGSNFVALLDTAFPILLSLGNNYFSTLKIDSEKLKLSTTQRNDLAPVADGVARELKISMSPTWMLVTMLGTMYTEKLMTLRVIEQEKIDKEKQAKKLQHEKDNNRTAQNGGRASDYNHLPQ